MKTTSILLTVALLATTASATLRGSSAARARTFERAMQSRRALSDDCIAADPYCACTAGDGCNLETGECDGCMVAGETVCVKTDGVDAAWCGANRGKWCTPTRTEHVRRMRCGRQAAPTKPAGTCACTSGPACTGLKAWDPDAPGHCDGCMVAGEDYCVTKGTPAVTRAWCAENKGDWCFLAEHMLADVQRYTTAYARAYTAKATSSAACLDKADADADAAASNPEQPRTHFGEPCYDLGISAEMTIRASGEFQASAEAHAEAGAGAEAEAHDHGCKTLAGKFGEACYEAQASAEAEVRASASADAGITLDANGFNAHLMAQVEVGATASAQASVSASYEAGDVSLSSAVFASATAEVAVEICGEAGVDVGKDGVEFFASGAADAHATAAAESEATFIAGFGDGWTVEGDVKADAQAGVWAEADGHANCDAKKGDTQGCDFGGSAEVGAGAKVSAEGSVEFTDCASASGGAGGEAGAVAGIGAGGHAGREGCRISAGAEGNVALALGAEIDFSVELDPCCMAKKIKQWIQGEGKKIAKSVVKAEKEVEKDAKKVAHFAKKAAKTVEKGVSHAAHKVGHWFKSAFGR